MPEPEALFLLATFKVDNTSQDSERATHCGLFAREESGEQGLKDGATKTQADESTRVNLCCGHVSGDSLSLFTTTRKPSSPVQSSLGGCSVTPHNREGAVQVFQTAPH